MRTVFSNAENGVVLMPYKIVMRKMKHGIPEIHYIHAKNTRDAKRKSLRFLNAEDPVWKIEYIRMTEFLVREECGVYED